jgi:hypothetical protein
MVLQSAVCVVIEPLGATSASFFTFVFVVVGSNVWIELVLLTRMLIEFVLVCRF